MPLLRRSFIADLSDLPERAVIRGWVYRLRVLANTTFIIVRDCSGEAQCVAATGTLNHLALKLDDVVEVEGGVRVEPRAKAGFEIDILRITILNPCAAGLPFNASSDVSRVSPELRMEHRPLSLRNVRIGDIFRVQAAILRYFREYLAAHRFTEIVSSKIVGGGTEGGTNLFEIRYFDRVAYLAQSPQFYKEHGVAGFERVFETGHVYRAEPHATSRHLTEYYSLDLRDGLHRRP